METPLFLQHHSFCSQGWLYHVQSKYFNPIPPYHYLRVLAVLLFPNKTKLQSYPYFHLYLLIFLPIKHLKTNKRNRLSLLTDIYASLKLSFTQDLLKQRQCKLSAYNLATARSWLYWQGQAERGNSFLCTVRYMEGSINLIISDPQSTWKEGNYIYIKKNLFNL